MSVLDRLVIALHRAGCAPITLIGENDVPEPTRARALGIALQQASEFPPNVSRVLCAAGDLLVQTADVRRVLEAQGRLLSADGHPLPMGVTENLLADLDAALASVPAVRASGVACVVRDAAGARAAERALWASLSSGSDGVVDRWFNRPVGRVLSKALIHTSVSPNQVSVCAILMGCSSAWLFALNAPVAGALLLQLSAVIDCVDGDLARILFKESPLGKWLDLVGDQVVHMSVFGAIAVGVARSGSEAPVLMLGASAVLGVIISFAVVACSLTRPAGRANTRLQGIIAATTNRDFSVSLLILALAGQMELFLWMTAIGVHAFWLLALYVLWRSERSAA